MGRRARITSSNGATRDLSGLGMACKELGMSRLHVLKLSFRAFLGWSVPVSGTYEQTYERYSAQKDRHCYSPATKTCKAWLVFKFKYPNQSKANKIGNLATVDAVAKSRCLA